MHAENVGGPDGWPTGSPAPPPDGNGAIDQMLSFLVHEHGSDSRPAPRFRVHLKRSGPHPVVCLEHAGHGLSKDRMREIARMLFAPTTVESASVQGALAFEHVGAGCEILSRAEGSPDTWALRLSKKGPAALESEHRRPLLRASTSLVVTDLYPAVLHGLSMHGLVDHLRVSRASALADGRYQVDVMDGLDCEVVTPDLADGMRLDLPTRPTLWGRVEFALYVGPDDWTERRVIVTGRGGATVVDDLSTLEEFKSSPWTSNQVAGRIAFDALAASVASGRVVRDRDVFPSFVAAVKAIEPRVNEALRDAGRTMRGGTSFARPVAKP